ncbi:hypothetical protein HPB47_019013 [Ixodes persulcatus]|uniref:Uncharacterized protein n=1 Tax=Ixodes persulcatus TaxID=34615 RepID=A0AC60QK58_IXOPE|nr:hypothetical protein HPB47_019013 [Ixodes persulcatus]
MSIKKQVDWDFKKVIGYCDLGHSIHNNNCVAYAKHALAKVYGLLDACHMLKLMRNLLAEKQCIRDGAGWVVAWEYLEALDSLQQQEGLHAANKLRKKHIDFQRQKMRVSLAAETLSRCLLTGKLSQDHLELFFATVRNRTGHNDNSTALEFRSAYRKCLVASVQPSTRGNCQVDGTATLIVSSSVCFVRCRVYRSECGRKLCQSNQVSRMLRECAVTSDKRVLVLAKDAGGLHSPFQDVLHLQCWSTTSSCGYNTCAVSKVPPKKGWFSDSFSRS